MIFGLPWFAVVAIVGILIPLGGMFYSFKEKELKMEEKRYANSKESQELRKMIFSLKARIEAAKPSITIDDIEIKDEGDSNSETSKVRG